MPGSLIKIFGERNSGTNLLRQIIRRNSSCVLWPGTIKELGASCAAEVLAGCADAGLDDRDAVIHREFLVDEIIDRCFDTCLGWKHAAPAVDRITASTRFRDTRFLVISKNPYAWLLSTFRTPYHNLLTGNVHSFNVFLRKPWLTTRRDNAPGIFRSPMELWNHKYRAYAEFAQIAPVTFVKYEDILEDPRIVFSASGIPLTSDSPLDIPQELLKGGADTFGSYRDMYRESFWSRLIDQGDMELINQHLDLRVMELLNYHKC